MRILAVDDDPAFLLLLESVLKEAGYEDVETAADADTALQRINDADKPHDCFLLDIQMPGLNGIELCQLIREMPAHPITPVLMLTAMLDDTSINDAFSAGASDYVTKPLNGLELGARIRSARLLTEQTRRSMGLEKSAERMKARLDTMMQASLSEALRLDPDSGCVSQRDLENALCLLPGKIFALEAFALRVDGIEELHAQLSQERFRAFLSAVAVGLTRALAPRQHYLSYAGDGVFGCVVLGSARRAAQPGREIGQLKAITVTPASEETREVTLSLCRSSERQIQSGARTIDSLRLAIAKASEISLIGRLQRDLDRDRLGRGAVVPRRPRLGVEMRLARPMSLRN